MLGKGALRPPRAFFSCEGPTLTRRAGPNDCAFPKAGHRLCQAGLSLSLPGQAEGSGGGRFPVSGSACQKIYSPDRKSYTPSRIFYPAGSPFRSPGGLSQREFPQVPRGACKRVSAKLLGRLPEVWRGKGGTVSSGAFAKVRMSLEDHLEGLAAYFYDVDAIPRQGEARGGVAVCFLAPHQLPTGGV